MNRKAFLLVVLLGLLPASWRRWISVRMGWEETSGEGMYYTPTSLTNRLLVCDPACGTGAFLVKASEAVVKAINTDERTMTLDRKTSKGTKELALEVAPEAGDLSLSMIPTVAVVRIVLA